MIQNKSNFATMATLQAIGIFFGLGNYIVPSIGMLFKGFAAFKLGKFYHFNQNPIFVLVFLKSDTKQ